MSPFLYGDEGERSRTPEMRKLPLVASPGAPELFHWPNANNSGYQINEQPLGTKQSKKIILLGAGASGINFLKTAQERLENVEVVCYEKNSNIGGTWLENTYPGVACDIPSVSYQFTWLPHIWPEYYSSGQEIWKYLRHIVDQYGLMQYIKLEHSIIGAEWLEEQGKWQVLVKGPDGKTMEDTCDIFMNAGGVLNNFRLPNIDGLTSFKGKLMHTAHWDNEYSLKGKRVAVIGAGSSAAQVVPNILPIVEGLHCFIKSPTWITAGFAQKYAGPDGGNFTYTDSQKGRLKSDDRFYLKYRKMIESELGQRFRFLMKNGPEATEARKFSESEMRRKLKNHDEIAEAIIPRDFAVGCRRPTPGEGFLEALVAPITTVHAKQMQRVTETGFVAHDGTTHDVDVIVCATGFDTSWVPRFPITAHGRNLQDVWREQGPLSYLGVGVPEMPNYFLSVGPYAPLAVGSLLPVIEVFTNYVISVITKMQVENIKSLSPKRAPALAFKEHHDLYIQRTAWSGPCSSWFKKGKSDGPMTMYPGSRAHFFELLDAPRYEDFDIRYTSKNQWAFLGNGFSLREFDGRDTTYWMGLLGGQDRQPEYDEQDTPQLDTV